LESVFTHTRPLPDGGEACCVDAAAPFALRELEGFGVEDAALAACADVPLSAAAFFFLDFDDEADGAAEAVSVAVEPLSVAFLLLFRDFVEVELVVA
jgi:DNA-binding transcriptional regulator YbjK